MENQNDCCAIIVYGDIGRSPRMQNHASEISRNTNLTIYLIGYDGNQKNNKIKNFLKISRIKTQRKNHRRPQN